MKKSKFSLLLTLALALSVFLAACGGDKASENEKEDGKGGSTANVKQEIKILDTTEIPTMDTVLAEGAQSFTYINNIGEGLYRLDQDGKPVPALADGEPQVNEDKTVYTFKLRDAKWSNGDPVTAQDFVYAWQRAIDPKTASPYGPYMMNGKIKGAQAISEAGAKKKKYDLNTLGVVAKDEKTLEVTLETPFVFTDDLFAFPTFYPQNQKFVEEKGDKYASNADNLLANGPFKMTSWDGPSGSEWVMEKNESYWDAENVTLDKISVNVVKDPNAQVNAFEAGEVDVTGLLSSDLVPQYEGDDRMQSELSASVYWLKMNQKNKALANVNIRKAIAMAFNKEDLAASILNNGSIPANFLVPKDFVTLEDGTDFREKNGDLLTYNLEEAQKAWKQGLKELGVDKLTLRYLGGDTESAKKQDAYMKNQLEKNLSGLTINLESVPFAIRLERDNSMDYDLQAAGWGPDYGNAISFADLWITDGGSNRMGYSNKKYDALIKAAQTTDATDKAKNDEDLLEAEKILLTEDFAIAPTYQRADNYLKATKVEGIVGYQYGPDYCYKWTKVTAE